MSNLVEHARTELALLGNADEPMQAAINEHLLKMVQMFADEGHSGFSAGYACGLLEKLLRFEPLNSLTGEDNEWCEIGDGVWQNKRCGHVFRDASRFDGRAYDIEARVFREPDGICFTGSGSAQPIEFPYTPVREYVDRPAS